MAKRDFDGPSGARAGASTGRSWTYWIIAAVLGLSGVADLVRGGETLAPIVLRVGYSVLIPLAILG
jgi:hypothetical protein